MSSGGDEDVPEGNCVLCWKIDSLGDDYNDWTYSEGLQNFCKELQISSRPTTCRRIIWRHWPISPMDNAISAFNFCTHKDIEKFGFELNFNDIQELWHATSSVNFYKIFTNIKNDILTLDCNLGKEWYEQNQKGVGKDFCPQGLLYFGLGIDFSSKGMTNEQLASTAMQYANQNRYGGAKLKIHSDFMFDETKRGKKLYKIGTKKYQNEYSQMVLVDTKPAIKCESKTDWNVLFLNGRLFHSRANLDEFKESTWEIKYCKNDCWTHPEVVFNNSAEISLEQVSVAFENWHKCIWKKAERHCSDCKLSISEMRCTKVTLDTNISYDENKQFYESDIFAKHSNEWRNDFAVVRFALMLSKVERNKLQDIVQQYPNFFWKSNGKKYVKCGKNFLNSVSF